MKTFLTGIKPTGTPHLGNYLGAIKPALQLYQEHIEERQLYFIADYHALNAIRDQAVLKRYTYEVAATWLALGLNPEKIMFYKQSDVPEIMELSCILSCFTPKGLMNRAHAYKAAVTKNQEKNQEVDANINMGLYTYPILMSADILMFNTDIVPVGKDQVQHVEIARDIATYFNNKYGETFVLPNVKINEEIREIKGFDGRKMSKSYGNAIDLFAPRKQLEKYIKKIKTDSTPLGEPKEINGSILFEIYSQFADSEKCTEMKQMFKDGVGYGEVKKVVFNEVNEQLIEPREQYNYYLEHTELIDKYLKQGSIKAREVAREFLNEIKERIGVR